MTTYDTGNPLGSQDPRDLFDNAQNLDRAANSLAAEEWIDRFGEPRKTWRGIEKQAQVQIDRAEAAAVEAAQARDDATAAAESIGPLKFYGTHAKALADAANWPTEGLIEIARDETRNGARTRYEPNGAVLDFVVNLDQLRLDVARPDGAGLVGYDPSSTYPPGTVGAGVAAVSDWALQNDSARYRAKNIAKLAWVDYQVHSHGAIKVLFQGDSMTAGFDGVSTDSVPATDGDWARRASMTYPIMFEQFLPEQSGCSVTRVMRAISGYTAKQAYEEPGWQVNPGCDVAVLMYGINDSNGIAGATLNDYMEFMEKLVRRFIDWGMGVVLCIPSAGGQGAGDPRWNYWARRARMMASVYGCAFFDGSEVSRYAHAGAIQSDDTHFNSAGYAQFGVRLASMFLAGGLLDTFRTVANEITYWPGQFNDCIGYCDTKSNVSTNRNDGTYTRSKIMGMFPAGVHSVASFSFYLDAEAAHIYGKVRGSFLIRIDPSIRFNNGAKPYYLLSAPQSVSYGMQQERPVYDMSTDFAADGARSFIGRVVGRGWHTLTFFTPQGSGQALPAFINALTIQPIPIGLSTDVMWGNSDERRVVSVIAKRIPAIANRASAPAAVALAPFVIHAPQSLVGTGSGDERWSYTDWFNCGSARLRVTNSAGDYFEGLIVKESGGNGFAVKEIASNFPSVNRPSFTAQFVKRASVVLSAKDSTGASQPVENILDYSGAASPDAFDFVSGVLLQISPTWPVGSPLSLWNIEIEGSDYFGNSETSFGSH